MHKGVRLTGDHGDLLMFTNRVVVTCFTKACSGEYMDRNSLILGTIWGINGAGKRPRPLSEKKEEDIMHPKLQVGFLLVKSLMTCLGIIVMSICGIFIRLRLAR
jgi:hypothetical protein